MAAREAGRHVRPRLELDLENCARDPDGQGRMLPGGGSGNGTVYILRLDNPGTWYVGFTQRPLQQRLQEHAGNEQGAPAVPGSAWCQVNGFSNHPDNIWFLEGKCDEDDESKWTVKIMRLKGMDNVRGGPWCQPGPLSNELRAHIDQEIRSGGGLCYNCGRPGHLSSGCPQPRRHRTAMTPAINIEQQQHQDFTDSDVEAEDGLEEAPSEGDAEDEADVATTAAASGNGSLPPQHPAASAVALLRQLASRIAASQLLHLEHFVQLRSASRMLVPFRNVEQQLHPPTRRFVCAYDARIRKRGIYQHQQEVLSSLSRADLPCHKLLTTGTGSGKSLCFLATVVDDLSKDPTASAVVAYPTQALLWDQADSLRRISQSLHGQLREDDPTCAELELAEYPLSSKNPEHKLCYGSTLHLGNNTSIPWTVWHGRSRGVTINCQMADHENSDHFSVARLFIVTLDKLHYSLASSSVGKRILPSLSTIVLDELHMLSGLLGANVRHLLQRIQMLHLLAPCSTAGARPGPGASSASASTSAPPQPARRPVRIFMASATINKAAEFAAKMLNILESDIHHVNDADAAADVSNVPVISRGCDDAEQWVTEHLPENQPPNRQLRVLLIVRGEPSMSDLKRLLSNSTLGNSRALLFSRSKLHSHKISKILRSQYSGTPRAVVPYDADFPPHSRRKQELLLNRAGQHPITVCGTNALEVGVDIPCLDVTVLPRVPVDRMSLMQQLGRCGRQPHRPGICVIFADAARPSSAALLNDPVAYLSAAMRDLQLPLVAESVTLAGMRCFLEDACSVGVLSCLDGLRHWTERFRLSFSGSEKLVQEILTDGEAAAGSNSASMMPASAASSSIDRIRQRLDSKFKQLVGAEDELPKDWFRSTFRDGSPQGMSQGGKVPLVLCSWKADGTLAEKRSAPSISWPRGRRWDVAWIDRMQLFQSAHPEAVYLGHNGVKYEIQGYTVSVPGRENDVMRLRNGLHNAAFHVDESRSVRCQECLLLVDRDILPRDCPYRTVHLHRPTDSVCLDCHPIVRDGASVPPPVGQCPLSSRKITPVPSSMWLSSIETVKVVKSENPGQPETFGSWNDVYDPCTKQNVEHDLQALESVSYSTWKLQRTWSGYSRGSDFVTCRMVEERVSRPFFHGRFAWELVVHRPFLASPAEFKTLGFEWTGVTLPPVLLAAIPTEHRESALIAAAYVIKHRVCGVISCDWGQMLLTIRCTPEEPPGTSLSVRVIDSSPGGNGMSWELLNRGGLFGSPKHPEMQGAWMNGGQADLMHGFTDAMIHRHVQMAHSREQESALKLLQDSPELRDNIRAILEHMRVEWHRQVQEAGAL